MKKKQFPRFILFRKKIFVCVFIFVAAILILYQFRDFNKNESASSKIQSNAEWKLWWSDEFNEGEINSQYWTLQEGRDIWGNNELQYYTARPENCHIENGMLIIAGRKENYEGKKYTSARIVTKDKVSFLFGKIEIRAKLPKGKGFLPAIWLLPLEKTFSQREKNGEIDIVEMLGNNPKAIYGVAHYLTKGKTRSSYKYYYGRDLSKEFHLYALEWDDDHLKWLIDNKVFYILDLKETFQEEFNPFTKKFYLIINLAIGGDWPGKVIDNQALPAVMQIDYVRYYKNSP